MPIEILEKIYNSIIQGSCVTRWTHEIRACLRRNRIDINEIDWYERFPTNDPGLQLLKDIHYWLSYENSQVQTFKDRFKIPLKEFLGK